ncbi:MAG: undecaprenyl-phosphate glucose phosphotransferase [Gammaproteobacteria bacterium]|nr:undecaprenyl-phosphate glucose phosphotransferase [Gammaproteobacteria bacterium]
MSTRSKIIQGENNFLFRKQLSLLSLIKLLLDPFVAILMLFVGAAAWGEEFRGPYVVFALIVFSLTFPGSWPAPNLKSFGNEIAIPWLTTVGILFLFGVVSGYRDVFPEDLVATWALLTPVALFFAHRVVHRLVPRILELEGSMRNAVIVGASELGQTLARKLNSGSHLGITFEGFFDDRSPSRIGTVAHGQVVGNIRDLVERAQQGGIDIIYIALPMASQPRILKLLDDLRDTTASIYFVPDIFVSDLIQARIDHIHGIPVVAVCETPLYGINGLLKRASDIVIASIILLLIFPLMIAIAIGVKLSSPGPVLFRQRRYGLDGKEIVVCKFRTMTVCEDGPTIEQAKRTDKRITPFGAFLRRTSLDELPQFLNVLTGQMSVVGPRPHAVAHNELYRKLVKGYMIRHKVKPGITGWAQVNGLRGETETVDKMQARIQYDIDYLRNWSIMFDFMIILKTVLVVARDRNAY